MPPGLRRRRLLGAAAASAAVAALPLRADAPPDPGRSPGIFAETDLPTALRACYGDRPLRDSPDILLEVAAIAEDGAIVPVQVRIGVPGARTLALFSDRNPVPLLARFHLSAALGPQLGTRIKLAETGTVLAIVDTGTDLLVARRPVTVTRGGCA